MTFFAVRLQISMHNVFLAWADPQGIQNQNPLHANLHTLGKLKYSPLKSGAWNGLISMKKRQNIWRQASFFKFYGSYWFSTSFPDMGPFETFVQHKISFRLVYNMSIFGRKIFWRRITSSDHKFTSTKILRKWPYLFSNLLIFMRFFYNEAVIHKRIFDVIFEVL